MRSTAATIPRLGDHIGVREPARLTARGLLCAGGALVVRRLLQQRRIVFTSLLLNCMHSTTRETTSSCTRPMRTSFSSRRAASRLRLGSTSIAVALHFEAAGRDADAGAGRHRPDSSSRSSARGPGQRRQHLRMPRPSVSRPSSSAPAGKIRSIARRFAPCLAPPASWPHASMESWFDSLTSHSGWIPPRGDDPHGRRRADWWSSRTRPRRAAASPCSAPRETGCRTRRSTTPTCAGDSDVGRTSTRSTSRPRRGSFCSGSARHPWSLAAVPVRPIGLSRPQNLQHCTLRHAADSAC